MLSKQISIIHSSQLETCSSQQQQPLQQQQQQQQQQQLEQSPITSIDVNANLIGILLKTNEKWEICAVNTKMSTGREVVMSVFSIFVWFLK